MLTPPKSQPSLIPRKIHQLRKHDLAKWGHVGITGCCVVAKMLIGGTGNCVHFQNSCSRPLSPRARKYPVPANFSVLPRNNCDGKGEQNSAPTCPFLRSEVGLAEQGAPKVASNVSVSPLLIVVEDAEVSVRTSRVLHAVFSITSPAISFTVSSYVIVGYFGYDHIPPYR